MSLLKFIKAQFGISNTPSNNFTLDASAQDGTMKLSRGNAGATTQDILVVDAAGKVTFPAGSQMLGVGQVWQNVTASRAAATDYTNSSGRPIQVIVSTATTSTSNNCQIKVDGLVISEFGISATGNPTSHSFIVPAGSVYRLDVANHTLLRWSELR